MCLVLKNNQYQTGDLVKEFLPNRIVSRNVNEKGENFDTAIY